MTKFKKGKSGNPSGRPKGIIDRRVKYREAIELRADELIKATVERALEGDMAALRLCLERICPAIKAKDEAVQIDEFEGGLSEQGQAVLKAMGNGEITPEESATVMRTLSAQARIIEIDELVRRIEVLEEINES